MKDIIIFFAIILVWFAINYYVLPKLGVNT